ncbi:SDR family oxidoreductase [Sphingobium sp. DEHP117]|uniref:SDR family NAD(P)-dependent oxidoreductase n=1 Tax=Sphingobium sp. DEHP117 TaxID=2993436 RepID=UPI0027D53C7E|nr:SDR family oxidoreductase [Sphingobium sp. DEHP117]MDQ4420364.1 SDR family oxidoreductase [Sphingobium sp. DEHP117]
MPTGVAVVTGAAGGMGSKCAACLARDGWKNLLLCDVDAARLEAVARPLRENGTNVEIIAGDITDPSFIAKIVSAAEARGIGALVHTAGIAPQMGTKERVLAINLDATLALVEAVRPLMTQGSAILLYASTASHIPEAPELEALFENPLPPGGSLSYADRVPGAMEAYKLSKRGVRALVRREARSFGKRGVRLVSISPGIVDTVMTEGEMNDPMRFMIDVAGVQRKGDPVELAEVSAFLVSPRASFITGTDLVVDGGQLAGIEHAEVAMPDLPK